MLVSRTSKLIIKLADTERLNKYMLYSLFVIVLGLQDVFLLKDVCSFLIERKLFPQDIKTRSNVLHFAN